MIILIYEGPINFDDTAQQIYSVYMAGIEDSDIFLSCEYIFVL